MPDPGVASLLCRITPDALGALPLTHVREIMRPLPVTPAGSGGDRRTGYATIRGIATPVVEAALLLGASVRATRVVALTSGSRQIALAVEDVLGLIQLCNASGSQLPLFDARVASLGAIDPALPGLLLTMQRVSSEDAGLVSAGVAAQ